MMQFLTTEQTNSMIDAGEILFIAGDGEALRKLRKGTWIAGSIPYFMGPDGGLQSQDRLLVCRVKDVTAIKIVSYGADELSRVSADYFANGYSLILIPSQSAPHMEFAKRATSDVNLLSGNLTGWITGSNLGDPAAEKPHIIDGRSLARIEDRAVVLHVELPPHLIARTEIVNIFEPGTGDEIEFVETSFEVSKCKVNGQETNFADYVRMKKIDTRFPLIADYSGAKINVSFSVVGEDKVSFFGPVFPGVKYRLAREVVDYAPAFRKNLKDIRREPAFACNCILNYLYASLEGQKCGPVGPMTFGEIAYILLNQTMVYLFVEEVRR